MDFNVISNDIAIDFGTAATRIYIKGQGLVLDEPSVIAYDNVSGDVIAAGAEAAVMIGRTPTTVSAVFPLAGGVVCDCTLAEELLKALLRRVCSKTIIKPRIMMSIPCGATDVERRALRDAAVIAGARRVCIMEVPIAAAIGSNCDVMLPRGLMVADIGAGCMDIASVSLGQIASSTSFKTAGMAFTDALIEHFKAYHSLAVGYLTAERCKKEVACVFPREKPVISTVTGLDLSSGLPVEINVTSEEIRDAMLPVSNAICEAMKSAVDSVPSELLGDILEDGILLTGGAAGMYGLVQRLKIDTELKLFLAPENEYSVIRGLAGAVDNIDRISKDLYTAYQG